jgi:hypothetical protein
MSDLSPKSRGLLDAARSARPSPAARERMSAALAARIGVAAIGAPPQPGPAAPAPPVAAPPLVPAPIASITAAMSTAKAIVLGTVIGVTSVGAALVWPHPPQPPSAAMHSAAEPSSSAARAETSAAPPAQAIEAAPPAPIAEVAPPSPEAPPDFEILEVVPDRARPPRAVPPAKASPPRESADQHLEQRAPALKEEPPAVPLGAISLGEETASLAEAQRSLKQGDSARAVALLDALAARHPTGVLREERLAANVFALCAAGRFVEARAAGQRFLAEMPASVQADRVRASCAFTSSNPR